MAKANALERVGKRSDALRAKWHANAKAAMMRKPDYFVWWYTVKSVGLCAAVGVAAYYAGKASGMRERR